MTNKMNFFTGLVFAYSLLVCFTCKKLNPSKCGILKDEVVKSTTVGVPPLQAEVTSPNIKVENGAIIFSSNSYTLK